MVVGTRHSEDGCKNPYNRHPSDDRVQLEEVVATMVDVSQVLNTS
jgi:hypothetical protein